MLRFPGMRRCTVLPRPVRSLRIQQGRADAELVSIPGSFRIALAADRPIAIDFRRRDGRCGDHFARGGFPAGRNTRLKALQGEFPMSTSTTVTRSGDSRSFADRVYPEQVFGGFTRCDGTLAFYSRVQAVLPEEATVLDVGCGRGRSAEDPSAYRRRLQNLQGPERTVIGIDVDFAAAGNPNLDQFRLIESTDRWPVEDASIDLLVSDYVLEHVDDPGSFFREIDRVMSPGGTVCLRTPNRWSYIAVIAQLIPNRLHARVTARVQEGREEQDVFPTRYRCNTRGTIRRQFRRLGYAAWVESIEAEPTYLQFSPLIYRMGSVVHRWLPPTFRSTLVAFARKPGTAAANRQSDSDRESRTA